MRPARKPLQFGLIGCGRVVRELHLPAWKQIPSARLVAACDSSPEALTAMSQLQPGIRQYRRVEDLLAHTDDFDFMVLATPGTSHPELGEQILARKLHLLCEKPLALDVASARRLFFAAETNGVLLTAIHNYRFRSNSIAALHSFRSGSLGDIASVNLRFHSGSLFDEPATWMRREREHKILLFDLAYHFVDLALLFLGPVASLRFADSAVDNLGLRYAAFGTLHDNGARGLFELMLDSSCARTEIQVLGEERGFALEFFPNGFRLLPRRDTPLHRAIGDIGRLGAYAGRRLKERLFIAAPGNSVPHKRLFAAFVEALIDGGPNPIGNEEVLRTISLLEHVAGRAYNEIELRSPSSAAFV
jgi:predicted dehydrogenase